MFECLQAEAVVEATPMQHRSKQKMSLLESDTYPPKSRQLSATGDHDAEMGYCA
jgi:hypothetical protein